MILIGLVGYANSGKDSVADVLTDHHRFIRVAFADPLKQALYDINPLIDESSGLRLQDAVDRFGWHEAKQMQEVRELLQRHGVSMRNNLNQDIWVNAGMKTADRYERVCISDTRFPNEWDAIKARGGYIIRIKRPGVTAVNAHVSEKAVDHLQEDASILNDGTLRDLKSKVEGVMGDLDFA